MPNESLPPQKPALPAGKLRLRGLLGGVGRSADSPNSHPPNGPILLCFFNCNLRFAAALYSQQCPRRGRICTLAAFRCRCRVPGRKPVGTPPSKGLNAHGIARRSSRERSRRASASVAGDQPRRLVAGVKGRRAAHGVCAICQSFIADMVGPDRCSDIKRGMLRRLAAVTVQAEMLEAKLAQLARRDAETL